MIGRLWAAAAVLLIAFVVLGLWVMQHPYGRLDAQSVALRPATLPLAIVFSQSGYAPALAVLGILSVAGAFALRVPLIVPLAILVSQLVSQAAVNVVKSGFARTRPAMWLYRREPGFSYPSGHATTAIVFYGAWLLTIWCAPLPLTGRLAGAAVLAVWLLGIGWSRVALRAHYRTDVIGGYLLGAAWLCATLALVLRYAAGFPHSLGVI